MDSLVQLDDCTSKLVIALKTLSAHHTTSYDFENLVDSPMMSSEATKEARKARSMILANICKIKALLQEPTDLLEQLSCQTQTLACIQWLGDFQILACIPLEGSVPISDLVDLAGVPEAQLCRIIRLTATSGFLHEPQPGYAAHTPLSTAFVTNPAYMDAAMFLAESAAPSALKMVHATQHFGDSRRQDESAYNLALNTMKPFHAARQEQPKLGRQWCAYMQHAGGSFAASNVADILDQLSFPGPCTGCIVQIGPESTATALHLARNYPSINIFVQLYVGNGGISSPHWSRAVGKTSGQQPLDVTARVAVVDRVPGARQTATDASLYILHLQSPPHSTLLAELRAHLGVLRANGGILLILTAHLLPEPGATADVGVEAVARSRDLTLLQLTNESEMEMSELLRMVDRTRDSVGKLVVARTLRSENGLVGALAVKYETV